MQNIYNYVPNVLVGINCVTTHMDADIDKNRQLDYSPEWPSRPYALSQDLIYSPSKFPRCQTNVFLETNAQCISELGERYSLKSMMSLDGLFSPISYYPTPYSATFNITKYPTPNCPFCYGTKVYISSVENDNITLNMTSAATQRTSRSDKSRPCPFCESLPSKLDKIYKSASPSEISPPFVIASGDDLTIISKMPTTGTSGNPVINYSTLNPIVITGGEFSNYQNKQTGDFTGHSIDLVGHSLAAPFGNHGLRLTYSKKIERGYSDYDLNFVEAKANLARGGVNIDGGPGLYNNMRFFGLRGPIMLHSWGYDMEGYPVPNSSGEPLIVGGTIIRDSDGNILGKNQQRKDDGTYTKPYKENTFYKGWAQQPGTWPVGPIDLRWDSNAGVWTVGANYKPVHVIIEEDLVGTNPSRGALVDSSYDNSPLPNDLRKLVFIKDSAGLYSAPRGGIIYCRYNSNNGFYEPIGHRPFMTSGIIKSSNTVDIYKIYSKPNDPNIRLSDDPALEIYNTSFKNPLSFNVSVNDVGLFTFMDGRWVLFSYKC